MKQRYLYLFLLLASITLFSCKSSQNAVGDNEVFAIVSDDYLDMEMTYVGSTFDYHILECHIINKYNRPIVVDRLHFELINEKKKVYERSLAPDDALALLDTQQDRLKKQKTASVITGILTTGLGIATNTALGGSAANSVAYSIESAIYIADDTRFFNRNINSIEEEKDYIDDYVLDIITIPARGKASTDLIFPIQKMRGDVEIFFVGPDNDYIFEFKASDFESR